MIVGAEEVGRREQEKESRDEDQSGPTMAESRAEGTSGLF